MHRNFFSSAGMSWHSYEVGCDQNWCGHIKNFKSSIACLMDIFISCKISTISDQLVGYMSLRDGGLVSVIDV